MPWGAAIGAVGALGSAAISSKKNGGAGTTTATKDPWIGAAPWMEQLLSQGNGLATGYFTNPFSERQTAARNNQFALNDAMKNQIPYLLMQLQQQPSGGFDPSKGNAAAQAQKPWDWTSLFSGGLLDRQRGLHGLGGNSASVSVAPAAPAAAPEPPPALYPEYVPAGGA